MDGQTQEALALLLANYIVNDDREAQDYDEHCRENDLKADDYLGNSKIEGAHIFAVAQAYLLRAEIQDDRAAGA